MFIFGKYHLKWKGFKVALFIQNLAKICLGPTRHNGFPVTFRGPNEEEPPAKVRNLFKFLSDLTFGNHLEELKKVSI